MSGIIVVGTQWGDEGKGKATDQLGGDIRVAVWDGPATVAARVEALPFLHEQAVSITNHRYGNPTSITEEILVEN